MFKAEFSSMSKAIECMLEDVQRFNVIERETDDDGSVVWVLSSDGDAIADDALSQPEGEVIGLVGNDEMSQALCITGIPRTFDNFSWLMPDTVRKLEAGDISGFTLGLTFEYSAETCYTDDPGAECYYMSAVWYS